MLIYGECLAFALIHVDRSFGNFHMMWIELLSNIYTCFMFIYDNGLALWKLFTWWLYMVIDALIVKLQLASGGAIARVRSLYRAPKRAPDPYFMIIFLIQLASTAVVIIFFAIRYLKLHNFRRWFPQLSVAIATGLVFGLLC